MNFFKINIKWIDNVYLPYIMILGLIEEREKSFVYFIH